VGVAQSLLSDSAASYIAEMRADYEKVRQRHAGKKSTKLWTLTQARANKTRVDWRAYQPPTPKFLGRRELRQLDLSTLVPYIDWGPFFRTWDLSGSFPAILDDEVVGEQARRAFADGQKMLQRIVQGRWLTASGVFGFWPANTENDDDIALYTDEARQHKAMTWYGMRQQGEKQVVDGVQRPSRCMADFIAPREGGLKDYIGMFAVTAGLNIEKKAREFDAVMDDYSSIMLKALADRLVEAFAEYLHLRVRTDYWGYASQEALDVSALIAGKYRGIRPAPGYPACPDHSVRRDQFDILQCNHIGMQITEALTMMPASSVCGFYLSHPESCYFSVGKIGADQVQDMAARRGLSEEDVRRMLAANL
jgi:5-methyltetrahydrofolate--homocysteine methyltransferase